MNRWAMHLVLGGVALGVAGCEGAANDAASESDVREIVSNEETPAPNDLEASVIGLAGFPNSDTAGFWFPNEDGAEVQVVESGVDSTTPRWSMSTEPELVLGMEGRDSTEVFSDIAYAARLADGQVLVLDGGTAEIRVFDSAGRVLARRGGRGAGPGEFRDFTRATLQEGDRLVVYDRFTRRVTSWRIDGGDPETQSLPNLTVTSRPDWRFLGVAENNRPIIAQAPEVLDQMMRLPSGDTLRYPVEIVLADSSEVEAETIATTYGPLHIAFVFSSALAGRPPPRRVVPLPLTHEVLAETDGRRIVASRTDRFELLVVDMDSGSRRLLRRLDFEPELIDDQIIQRYESLGIRPGMVPQGGTEPQFVEFPLEQLIGSPLPTHSRIILDEAGRIWVREAAHPWDEGPPSEWTVFGEGGRIEAVASLPEGMEVFHIGENHVTGRTRDALGVESVVVYRILSD